MLGNLPSPVYSLLRTGRLEASYVGPGNASEAATGKAVVSRRRTSQNMMMDDFMTTRNPRTARIVKSLHTKSLNLFAAGGQKLMCTGTLLQGTMRY